MRTYTFGERKGLKWAPSALDKIFIGLYVIALILLIVDYVSYGTLMNYVLFGVK